jgi:hypothetical protein
MPCNACLKTQHMQVCTQLTCTYLCGGAEVGPPHLGDTLLVSQDSQVHLLQSVRGLDCGLNRYINILYFMCVNDIFLPLSPLTEDSLRRSTIPGGNQPRDWQPTAG